MPLLSVSEPAVCTPCPAWCEREPTDSSYGTSTVGASVGSPSVPIVTVPSFTLNARNP